MELTRTRIANLALFSLATAFTFACAPPDDWEDDEALGGEEELGEAESAVINGTPINEEQSGYVRFLGCSGTLMTNEWVLTARHCLSASRVANPGFAVSMGTQSSAGAEVVLYPYDDVAMIRLVTPMAMNGSFSGFERRLYPFRTNTLQPGTPLTCNGYGYNDWNTMTGAGTLRTAVLPVRGVNFTFWTTHYDLAVNRNAQGQYMAKGDSGGSCLFTMPGGERVLAGVTSTVYNNIDGVFNGLVDPDSFRTWYEGIRVTHNVVNQANGECLDEYTGDYSTITQWNCAENANQHWRIVPLGGAFFELRASDTGKCLASFGDPIAASTCDSTFSTQWALTHAGDGFYEVRNRANNLCLDVPWGSPQFGLTLHTYSCTNTSNQRFRFDARFPKSFQALTPANAAGQTCLDIAGASGSSGAPLQLNGCYGFDNQQFRLSQTSGDDHTVSPRHAQGQCLDLPWGTSNDGVQLQQWACVPGATNQALAGHWRDGAYELRLKSSGSCVSVASNVAANNYAPVVQNTCGAPGFTQLWFLF